MDVVKKRQITNVETTFYSFLKVSNTGQSLQTFGSASLNILWPHELINGKWLLYPSVLQLDGQPDTQCEPQSALNPLRLALGEPPHSADAKVFRKNVGFCLH